MEPRVLCAFGKVSCLEELDLSHPEQILGIHQAYLQAGAEVIQTNTYAANSLKLTRCGLESSVKSINTAAIKLAKQVVQKNGYILASMGGNRGLNLQSISLEEIKQSSRKQLSFLPIQTQGILMY